jgi:UDP-4-amino-4,6-dideoxy-N-acetyl-beta-L-altrosamine transaminase
MADFLPYGRQSIDDSDIAAVVEVLRGNWLTTGPAVDRFEAALSEVCGGAEAVVVANGTVALQIAMHVSGIGPGTSVVVPAVTFLASANAARYLGAEVVFADIDPGSGLMTPDLCARAIAAAPAPVKAIVPVHLGGRICDLAALRKLADEVGAALIEDACHAIGGRDAAGDPVGACSISDSACFSFHPVKTITSGEGGAVTTRDAALAKRMRRLRHHGIETDPANWINRDQGFENGTRNPWYHEMAELGYNFRLTDIHCALGASQTAKLARFVARRAELADIYDACLAGDAPLIRPSDGGSESARGLHLYQVAIDFAGAGTTRGVVMEHLKDAGIGTQVHYIPVPWQPYYQAYRRDKTNVTEDFPGAEAFYRATLSLPLHPDMADDDPPRVVDALRAALTAGASA